MTDECGTEGVRLFSHRLSVIPRLWSYFWYSKTRKKTLKIPTATVMLRESTLGNCSASGDVSKRSGWTRCGPIPAHDQRSIALRRHPVEDKLSGRIGSMCRPLVGALRPHRMR